MAPGVELPAVPPGDALLVLENTSNTWIPCYRKVESSNKSILTFNESLAFCFGKPANYGDI